MRPLGLSPSFVPPGCPRIFGFHPWSLGRPQVIEGVAAVLALVLLRAARRWAGAAHASQRV